MERCRWRFPGHGSRSATDAYTRDLAGMHQTLLPVSSQMIATEPLTDAATSETGLIDWRRLRTAWSTTDLRLQVSLIGVRHAEDNSNISTKLPMSTC